MLSIFTIGIASGVVIGQIYFPNNIVKTKQVPTPCIGSPSWKVVNLGYPYSVWQNATGTYVATPNSPFRVVRLTQKTNLTEGYAYQLWANITLYYFKGPSVCQTLDYNYTTATINWAKLEPMT